MLTKTLGRERDLTARFAAESQQLADNELASAMSGRWVLSSRRAALTMVPAIVYWIAGISLAHGSAPISIGTAVAFTSTLNRLVGPTTALQNIGVQVSTSIALFVRIFEVLDLPVDVAQRSTARRLTDVRGEVRFDAVSLRYDREGEWTLRDIDLLVPAGTTTAIVGETGAGKTTLAFLAAAVAAARIERVVKSLPAGYDTVVGARGYRFSGGERQRLAIARMLLRNPRILILDEATSALDTETERAVQAALEELAKGRTTIAIAHRLSTVRNADQIVMLDQGRILEWGTHDQLLERGGRYARLAGQLIT